MSSRFALLIGVNHYPGAANALRAPGNDVAAWARLLADLGFEAGNVRVLADAPPPGLEGARAPTTGEVNAALANLLEGLTAAGPGATLYVFFAGHGDFTAAGHGSLYLADYTESNATGRFAEAGTLYLERLREVLDGHPSGARLVALVDACRTLTSSTIPDSAHIQDHWRQAGRCLVTAARPGEGSYERAFAGVWHGQFTWALTTLIEQWKWGRDAAGNRYVEASPGTLIERACQLIAAVSSAGEPQTPRYFCSPLEAGLPLIAGLGAEGAHTLSQPQNAPGHEFEGNTWGVIQANGSSNSETLGWFYESGSKQLSILSKTTALPGLGGTIWFNALTESGVPVPSPSGVQSVWVTPPNRGAWTLHQGNAPTNTMATSGSLGLEPLANVPNAWRWFWFRPTATSLLNSGTNSETDLSQGVMDTAVVGCELYSAVDEFYRCFLPWGNGIGEGNVEVGGSVFAKVTLAGSGNLVFAAKSAFTAGMKATFKTTTTHPSPVTKTYDALPSGWFILPSLPTSTMAVNASGAATRGFEVVETSSPPSEVGNVKLRWYAKVANPASPTQPPPSLPFPVLTTPSAMEQTGTLAAASGFSWYVYELSLVKRP